MKYNIEAFLNGELLKNSKYDLDGTDESYIKVIQKELVDNLFWKGQMISGSLDRQNYDKSTTDAEILEIAQDRIKYLNETIQRLLELKFLNEYKKDEACIFCIKNLGNHFQEITMSLNELNYDNDVMNRLSYTDLNDHVFQEIDAYYKDLVANSLWNELLVDEESDLEFDFTSINDEQEKKLIILKSDENLKLLNLCQDKSGNDIYVFVIEDSFVFNCHKDDIKKVIKEEVIKEAKKLISSLSQSCSQGGQ